MKITKNLTTINRTIYKNRKIEYIVIHYFGSLGTAKAVSNYFKTAKRQASAHYCVDDTSIYQCVEDKDAAWHCADKGLGQYKHMCRNSNSIGIEVRPYKMNAKTMNASDKDWYFHDETIANVVELTLYLMDKYNIPVENVIRHYDVTAKLCPRPFVGGDVNSYYKKTGDQKWLEFKTILKEGGPVTQQEFNEKMAVYLKEVAAKEPDDWSLKARVWAESENLILGDTKGKKNYKSSVTREEMVMFMKRLFDLIKR